MPWLDEALETDDSDDLEEEVLRLLLAATEYSVNERRAGGGRILEASSWLDCNELVWFDVDAARGLTGGDSIFIELLLNASKLKAGGSFIVVPLRNLVSEGETDVEVVDQLSSTSGIDDVRQGDTNEVPCFSSSAKRHAWEQYKPPGCVCLSHQMQ